MPKGKQLRVGRKLVVTGPNLACSVHCPNGQGSTSLLCSNAGVYQRSSKPLESKRNVFIDKLNHLGPLAWT